MPNDTHPVGYLEAREQFSRKFLQMFDQLVFQSTPGTGTAIATLLFPPAGLLMNWGYNRSRKELLNNLVAISSDNARRLLVDQDSIINALAEDVINLSDVAIMPIQSLQFILKPATLSFIKQNEKATQQQREIVRTELSKLERLERVGQVNQNKIDETRKKLNKLESVMDKFRKANYSSEALTRHFQELIPELTQTTAREWTPAPAPQAAHENTFQWIPSTKKDKYQAALTALKNTLPSIKDYKIFAKTSQIISQVQQLEKQGHPSKTDLTEILSRTHALLHGNIQIENYYRFAKKAHGSPTTGMKVLGALMIALGTLAIAAGIVIAATGTGFGIGVGVAAAGVAISASSALFFAPKGLSEAMTSLAKEEISQALN